MKLPNTFSILLFFSLSFVNAQSLIKVKVKANKLAYDNTRNLLYATVSAQDSTYGNQLVAIDASNGHIVKNIFIGSEPDMMALTSDHNYMFIGLGGATLVKKINLIQFTVDSQINLGSSPISGGYFPYDLATITNRNDIVIVSRFFPNISPSTAGIVVYKGQQQLPNVGGLVHNNTLIEFDSKNGFLYGFNDQTTGSELSTFSIDTVQGPIELNTVVVNLGYKIKYANNFLFSNEKTVIDLSVSPPYQAGTFSYNQSVWGWSFAVDDSAKTYYIVDTDQYANDVTVASFNVSTFVQTGSITYSNTIPNNNYEPIDMEAIGSVGYAIVLLDTYNSSFNNPAGGYVLLKTTQTVGIKDIKSEGDNVTLYPNPVADHLNITGLSGLSVQKKITLQITDISGREILNENILIGGEISIDTHILNKGVYFVSIQKDDAGQKIVKRIIKE